MPEVEGAATAAAAALSSSSFLSESDVSDFLKKLILAALRVKYSDCVNGLK